MRHYSQLNPDHFVQRDCVVGGDDCLLIFPSHLGCEWEWDTLRYRSLILRKSDGLVVSHGHWKFLNAGEKPHLYPDPTLYDDWHVSDKLDGSLCIVSRHNGELIVRTRGVVDCRAHETGEEMRRLAEQHFTLGTFSLLESSVGTYSYLFEHVTPSHPIVLRYEKPELVLLDIVRNADGAYLPVEVVDEMARLLGCRRPERFTFGSLSEIVETCRTLKGREGFVLAYKHNQQRVKLKADDYLVKHRLKSEIGSLSKLLDRWFSTGKPCAQIFYSDIAAELDFELAEQAKPQIEQIVAAAGKAHTHICEIEHEVIHPWRLAPRKQAAEHILATYQGVDKQIAFLALDNRPVSDKLLRTMIEDSIAANL